MKKSLLKTLGISVILASAGLISTGVSFNNYFSRREYVIYQNHDESKTQSATLQISLEDLVKNPEKFEGKVVRIELTPTYFLESKKTRILDWISCFIEQEPKSIYDPYSYLSYYSVVRIIENERAKNYSQSYADRIEEPNEKSKLTVEGRINSGIFIDYIGPVEGVYFNGTNAEIEGKRYKLPENSLLIRIR